MQALKRWFYVGETSRSIHAVRLRKYSQMLAVPPGLKPLIGGFSSDVVGISS